MAKMSDYPSVENTDEFTQEQKAAFLGSAMCIATGSKTDGGSKVTANIPLSDIAPAVPTKLSDLTDDITVDTYDATSEAPISGKGVASALANFGGFIATTIGQDGKPVVEGTPDQKKIYLTPTGESGTENTYDEWICTDATVPTWEKVGVTRVDLSQYYTKTEADGAFVSKTGYVATDNNYTTTEKTKLGGIETGAEVNKINSISIDDTELEIDENKNVNINIDDGGLRFNNASLEISTGTGGLYVDNGELDIHCKSPLANWSAYDERYIKLEYDDTLTIIDYGTNPQRPDEKLSVKNPVPTPAAAHADVGKVLTVQQASDPDDPDEIVWATPQGGSLPTYDSTDAGKVLAVNQAGDGVEWTNAGGGGSCNVEQINMLCLKNESTAGKTVIQTVTMTPKQALQSYNSGKTLILNVIVKTNLSSDEIWEQYTYPLSYLGYGWAGDDRYYILYFDYISALQGTGGNLWNGVKGKLDTTDGTWEISSPSDN